MSLFRFKQFTVDQSACAMKINTDGVLLGALAKGCNPARILDVGTGTGVISLMLAQRFPLAMVDAIEIDPLAAGTACRNFSGSPFADRLKGYAVSLSNFEPEGGYDLIVSNPPFFIHSLKNKDPRQRIARHTDMFFFEQLLVRARCWLRPEGSLQLIMPTLLADAIGKKARNDYTLFVRGTVLVRSFPSTAPNRCILNIGMSPGPMEHRVDQFTIYERPGVYSVAYRELLAAFFLAF